MTPRGQDEVLTNKVANSAAPRGVSGTRVERWHGLAEELVMSFAMGTHARLGAGVGVSSSGGRRRSLRVQGKAPAGGEDDRRCQYFMMQADLVKRVVEACTWEEEGKECCS